MPAAAEHADWLAKVDEYIRLGDRSEEPCFVGRADLFEAVAGQIDVSAIDAGGRTMVFHGAPGVGKSAFLRELSRRLADSGDAVPVIVDSSQCTPWGIFEALSQVTDVEVRDKTERTSTKGAGAAIAGFGGRHENATKTTTEADIARANAQTSVPWGLMTESLKDRLHGKPVALLCDETQALDTADPKVRGAVRSLHVGNGAFPIVPVFAGLADTTDALGHCGVTRPSGNNEQIVKPLTGTESGEFVRAALGHLQAEGEAATLDALVGWAVDNADGWPQHLRIATGAVAKAMRNAATPKLAELDAQAIRERVCEARSSFYGLRLRAATPPNATPRPALAAMAEQSCDADGLTWLDLTDTARAVHATRGGVPDPDALVRMAVHAGVLQAVSPARPDYYVCPIPSMVTYLRDGEYQAPELVWPKAC